MDFNGFSHSQMHSKIWLCENLEPYLQNNSKIIVLGCWYNLMGILIMVRNPHKNLVIKGVDIDQKAIEIADNITTAWRFEYNNPFKNECADANTYDISGYDIIINCSVEHMEQTKWFENIPEGKLVCIQSVDLNLMNDPIFKITNPNPTIETFTEKYKMAKTLFLGSKRFEYPKNPFTRFCHIGIK